MAPNAKKGPKGIWLSFGLKMNRYTNPMHEPMREPIKRVIQQPNGPTKAPINARRSRSPWPRPSFPEYFLKMRPVRYKTA